MSAQAKAAAIVILPIVWLTALIVAASVGRYSAPWWVCISIVYSPFPAAALFALSALYFHLVDYFTEQQS